MDQRGMAAILDRIAYTREMNLVIDSTRDGEVRMTLPAAESTSNLMGTVHAGALFTFGETVAGVAAGLETLDHAFPFAQHAKIHYRRPARGVVHGYAGVKSSEIQRVLAEISKDGRSQLSVAVRLEGADGRTVAEMDVDYAFRPVEKT